MSHHSSSVNGEGTSHKDPLYRILDELSSLKLWKEKLKSTQFDLINTCTFVVVCGKYLVPKKRRQKNFKR